MAAAPARGTAAPTSDAPSLAARPVIDSCVDAFLVIQPIGLGFAAGAMLWVAWLELFVESYESCGLLSTSAVGVTSASLMSLCHAYLIAA